jgi:hypothetical protein
VAVVSDDFEPVSVCPHAVNLCGTKKPPLGESSGAAELVVRM